MFIAILTLGLTPPASSNAATIAQASGKANDANASEPSPTGRGTVKCSLPPKVVHNKLRTYVKQQANKREWPTLKAKVCYERSLTHIYITGKSPYISKQLIIAFFGPRHPSARKVARCESTYHVAGRTRGVYAKNGQYVGVYQMGTNERKEYGWYDRGWPSYYHVKSAHRMSQGGRNWSRWSCKP